MAEQRAQDTEQARYDKESDEARERYAEEPHWPDAPIQDIPDDEREALLKQAGPPGEMARVAWQRYQDEQRTERGDEPEAVMREQTRLEEMTGATQPGTIKSGVPGLGEAQPQESTPHQTVTTDPATGTLTPAVEKTPADAGSDDAIDTEEEETAETGSQTEREQAEAKAATLGLEVRDYGTAGDWRVYDPATGRQVAKSTVLG